MERFRDICFHDRQASIWTKPMHYFPRARTRNGCTYIYSDTQLCYQSTGQETDPLILAASISVTL
jgi:hypothetical protein